MSSAEDAYAVLGGVVLESGHRWGEVAHEVQRADAQAVFDLEAEARRHVIVRSRGYSKTEDAGGMSVAELVTQLAPGAEAYAAAADRDQAGILLRKIAGLVERTPELHGVVEVGAARVTVPSRGTSLEILSADAASSWGLTPAWLVVDEWAAWPESINAKTFYEALITSLPKARGRAVMISTPGSPSHWSKKAIFDRASSDSLYRLSHVHGAPPWMDPREVEAERRALPEAVFRRLFNAEWAEAGDQLATREDVLACVGHSGPLPPRRGVRYSIGLDLGVKHDATVAVVCHAEPREVSYEVSRREGLQAHPTGVRIVVDRLQRWRGSRLRPVQLAAVQEWVLEAARSYGAVITFDPWQGLKMGQELRAAGVPTEEFTFSAGSVGRLAATLFQLIRERSLVIPDDQDLIDELATVQLRETSPGVLRMDTARGRHDDQAIAIALASQALINGTNVERLRDNVPRVVRGTRWALTTAR